jgi:hypothetical protein
MKPAPCGLRAFQPKFGAFSKIRDAGYACEGIVRIAASEATRLEGFVVTMIRIRSDQESFQCGY